MLKKRYKVIIIPHVSSHGDGGYHVIVLDDDDIVQIYYPVWSLLYLSRWML